MSAPKARVRNFPPEDDVMTIETTASQKPASFNRRLGVPKSIAVIAQEGYRFADFRADALAGLTVAVVVLPLAMAIVIISGTAPNNALITTVIAGFLISVLGSSRFQIGGPSGAFIVVLCGVIQQHGFRRPDARHANAEAVSTLCAAITRAEGLL